MLDNIILFTLNGCHHCKTLKKSLQKHDIQFYEIEITNNEKIWDQVVNQTGHNSLPTIFVRKENTDDGLVYVAGVDFMSDEEGIKLIKQHI